MPKFMPYGRRKMYRRKAKRALKKSQKRFLKTYNYKFQLPPQVIVASQSTGGIVNVFGDGTNNVPLTPAALTVNPSLTGFAGFCELAFGTSFQLSNIENYSKYVDLYDAYKINSITLKLTYLNNNSIAGGSGLMPTCYLAWDQDSDFTPANIQAIKGIQGVRTLHFGADRTTMVFKFRPTMALVAQGSIPGSAVTKSSWIDSVRPDVVHYAIKAWITDFYAPGISTTANGFRLDWTYDVSFRSPTDAT